MQGIEMNSSGHYIIQDLDLMILVGPFQLGIFYDSVILCHPTCDSCCSYHFWCRVMDLTRQQSGTARQQDNYCPILTL